MNKKYIKRAWEVGRKNIENYPRLTSILEKGLNDSEKERYCSVKEIKKELKSWKESW
ncbi:hypothetical protein [Planococcus lenghuensis]|uniref:hypothetical protein n=1 Tax=Planococcus lenghuensis TaxID=2213202 RepID=UPI0012EB502A|nr:hypothetical protein [Planococcus lenghuensis]